MSNPLLAGLRPTHPGEILREEIVPALGLSKTAIARRLGISRQTLPDILAERMPVTPAMALPLSRLFATSPELWINLQRDCDLSVLEREMAEALARIEPIAHPAETDASPA